MFINGQDYVDTLVGSQKRWKVKFQGHGLEENDQLLLGLCKRRRLMVSKETRFHRVTLKLFLSNNVPLQKSFFNHLAERKYGHFIALGKDMTFIFFEMEVSLFPRLSLKP